MAQFANLHATHHHWLSCPDDAKLQQLPQLTRIYFLILNGAKKPPNPFFYNYAINNLIVHTK